MEADLDTFRRAVSANIRALRHACHLTQERVSELADINLRHYQSIEAAKDNNITIVLVFKLAKAFGVTPSRLLENTSSLPR